MEPKGFVVIEAGKISVKEPKKSRKGAAHCMAVRQEGSAKDAKFKLVRLFQPSDCSSPLATQYCDMPRRRKGVLTSASA
jgi:hypothetical protein